MANVEQKNDTYVANVEHTVRLHISRCAAERDIWGQIVAFVQISGDSKHAFETD